MSTAGAGLRTGLRGLWWYLREVSGEAAFEAEYARHVAGHRAAHPDLPPPTRREFERTRQRAGDTGPPQRCC